MMLSQDILVELVEIVFGFLFDQVCVVCDVVICYVQGSYEVLFCQQDVDFFFDECFVVVVKVVKLYQVDVLVVYYVGFGFVDLIIDCLVLVLVFVCLFIFIFVEVIFGVLYILISVGWSLWGIVILVQLVVFVSFQS